MRITFVVLSFLLLSCSLGTRNELREIPDGVLRVLNDTSAFVFNTDYEKRDKLLGIKPDWTGQNGGLEYIDEIKIDLLDKLLIDGFIDPEGYQNESPTTKEFYEFMNKFPKVSAHGYAISPQRDDYRITLEGLHVKESDVTTELKTEFFNLCKEADEYFDEGELYSWWD